LRKPILFALLLLASLGLGLALMGRLPDLDAFRSLVDGLQARVAANFWAAAAIFLCTYVAATSLSLPVAVWLTLAGGALFGFVWGTVLTSFGASLGATGAFLLSRHLLRDSVQSRFGDRLGTVNRGVARDGALYLFTLRLIPVLPFFAINLLMGLTPMRTGTFYAVSQIAMLPAGMVYVNAGTRLAGLERIEDIVSPPLLLSFAALGLVPWFGKLLAGFLRRRRLRSRWTRPARFDRNLIVIGAGAAGLVTAYVAAAVKARVTLVESGRMGGDCLNTGCVPSKALIRSAKAAHQMRHASRYGFADHEPEIPFREVMARVRRVIGDIAPHDSVERYTSLGVDVVQGRGKVIDPWTVEIAQPDGTSRRLTARAIVLATGAAPVIPPVPGLPEAGPLTPETLWDALADRDHPPRSLAVLGGGPAGCELAQAFARLGSEVTLIEALPRLLPKEDAEAAGLVTGSLVADGVRILAGHGATAAGREGGVRWITLSDAAGAGLRVDCDEILVTAGRRVRSDGLGLEDLGIQADPVIETDEWLETLCPGIYAAGDAAGPFQLTHAGAHQGWHAAVNALFGQFRKTRVDYRCLPATVFTDPEVARVGPTEEEARQKGLVVEVTRFPLARLDRAITDGATEGFVKVLTPPGRDRILGVTIAGEHAGDLLAEFVLAMRHGLGLSKILSTVHSYPTLAEAAKLTAGEWRRAHVSPRLLALLERYHGWRRG